MRRTLQSINIVKNKERGYYTGWGAGTRRFLFVKYGTENGKQIWTFRYGFSFEDIEWLEPYIANISQEEVIFDREVNRLTFEKMNIIKRFM